MTAVTAPWPVYPPEDFDSSQFEWLEYMRLFPVEALERGAGRRNLTRYNPLLFALMYFRHHLQDEKGEITFSDFHLESCYTALNWARPITKPKQYRDAVIAPRATGKSTWWFLILPMWAAAHGHVKFLAAYSDTSTQAERHLSTFKQELENNALLRKDFRELGEPSMRSRTGKPVADNQNMLQTASGFTFAASGIESGTLGLKVGALRPDLLVLDDIEPGESSYSLHQMGKRLGTIQDVILPLNLNARVVIAGTVTMTGSIIHQLVNSVATEEKAAMWIAEENIKVHYSRPIIDCEDGTQRSLWPAKWPVEFLKTIQHTRSYSKNFANQPIGADGSYWNENSFTYVDSHDGAVSTYLSIDPSVTSGKASDYTGLAVVSYIPPGSYVDSAMQKAVNPNGLRGTAVVQHASHVRLSPGPDFRAHVLNLLATHPDVRLILIETNQGGDTWKAILHNMPVPVETVHQRINKEVRAAGLLTDYETGHVVHEGRHTDAELEMQSFPLGSNDDMVDAIGSAVIRMRQQEAMRIARANTRPSRTRSSTYA